MLWVAAFVAGVGFGVVVMYALTGRRLAPKPRRISGDGGRERSTTPVSVLLGEETREIRALTDPGFASLGEEFLRDIIAQHGASAAGIWRGREGAMTLTEVVGDRSIAEGMDHVLQPMLAWSMREEVVHLGPDGDAPLAAVAPLGAVEGRPIGALALMFDQTFVGDRHALKGWMRRHGEQIGLILELLRTHGELAKTNKRTRGMLRELRKLDGDDLSVDLGTRLCAMIEQLTGADGSALVRWDADTMMGVVVVADGTCAKYAGSAVEEDSLAGSACRENVAQLWHEVSRRGEGPEALFSAALPTQTGCVVVQPLQRGTTVIGAVVATHAEPGSLGPAELRALALFDAVASSRLASAWRLEEVTRRALVDGLTGLTNRVGFEAHMHTALGEQMRYNWEVSLVIVDVDHFKRVNDTHGHEVGDAVLRAIAATLEEGIRATDVAARVGGEEMALILKDTGVDGAMELAERLRAGIAAQRIPFGPDEIRVTASFGVATYPTEVKEWEALYRSADRALYEAKAAGRNQVRGQAGPVDPPPVVSTT
jgi:diguanylate cyclase (GGDEF)-like protein